MAWRRDRSVLFRVRLSCGASVIVMFDHVEKSGKGLSLTVQVRASSCADRTPARSGIGGEDWAAADRVRMFISQTAAWPLAFCQRMSEWPSPLKSPVPTSDQLGPGLAAILVGAADHLQPVHFPDRRLPVLRVLEQDVGMAVAVEVAGSQWPSSSLSGSGGTSGPPITHRGSSPRSRLAPLVFRHRMSEWPSSLKSPVPTAVQARLGIGADERRRRSRRRNRSSPRSRPAHLAFCHRMSDWPSSLKSPVPTTRQAEPGVRADSRRRRSRAWSRSSPARPPPGRWRSATGCRDCRRR